MSAASIKPLQQSRLKKVNAKFKIIQKSFQTSSTTKTTTINTPAKLYGKDLSEYDEVDVDALLAQLSPEEINILAKEVDPDVSFYLIYIKYIFMTQALDYIFFMESNLDIK